jgi:hypothetical protein
VIVLGINPCGAFSVETMPEILSILSGPDEIFWVMPQYKS